MTVVRSVLAATALALLLIWTGCGDVYRPVATPITPNPPNPGFTHLVLVLSGNGLNNPGASSTIDVSGDTTVSQSTLGLMPVHAALLPSITVAYAANSLDDTVSEYFAITPSPVETIGLPSSCGAPPCSNPVFVATSENATVYVANSGDGTENAAVHIAKSGNGTVAVIATANNVVANTIPVGINPVGVAEIPNGQTLYVANAGNGTSNGSVTSVNTIDQTVNPPIKSLNPPNTNAVWISPVWVAARSDSARVYVLDKGAGTVSAIDTSSDTVVGVASVGVGADFMVYNPTLNRLYVANPVSGAVFMLAASTDALATVAAPAAIANPVSVAALPDGTRIYVSSATVSGLTVTSKVTVINTADGSVKTTIPLTSVRQVCASTPYELFTAAAADSSRVYVGNCDVGNTAVIQTSDDTLLLQLAAPVSAQKPVNGVPPPQNPVFVLAGP